MSSSNLKIRKPDHEKDIHPVCGGTYDRADRMPELPRRRNLRVDDRDIQGGKRHQGAGIPELHQDQQPLRRRRTVAADDRAGDGHLPARQEPGRCGPVRLLRARRHQRQCGMAVEPLLQGAVQHQPVLRNDRPDALCRRGRKEPVQSGDVCHAGSVPVDRHRDVGRQLPADDNRRDRGHRSPPFAPREVLRRDHRRTRGSHRAIPRHAHHGIGAHRHARSQGAARTHVPLQRTVGRGRRHGIAGDRPLRAGALPLAQRPVGRRQNQQRIHLDDGIHRGRRLPPGQRLLVVVCHVYRPFPGRADHAQMDGLRRLPGDPLDLLHGSVRPRRRQTLERPAPMGMVLQRPGRRPLGLPAQPVARIHRHGALPLPRRAAAGRA